MMEEQTDWDIVVIGGGVVGCAVFRQFCLMGARTLLLEKGRYPVRRQQSQQRAAAYRLRCAQRQPGAALHAGRLPGIYRHPRTNESAAAAHRRAGRGPDEQQLAALPAIVQQAHDNGVLDVTQIDAAELYRREPQLAPGALAAVEVPERA